MRGRRPKARRSYNTLGHLSTACAQQQRVYRRRACASCCCRVPPRAAAGYAPQAAPPQPRSRQPSSVCSPLHRSCGMGRHPTHPPPFLPIAWQCHEFGPGGPWRLGILWSHWVPSHCLGRSSWPPFTRAFSIASGLPGAPFPAAPCCGHVLPVCHARASGHADWRRQAAPDQHRRPKDHGATEPANRR